METSKRYLEPSAKTIVYTPSGMKSLKVLAVSLDTKEYITSLEELVDRVVKRIVTEPQPVPSPQVSTGTVIMDSDEEPPTEEHKLVGLSAADVQNKQVVPLLRYLNRKLKN